MWCRVRRPLLLIRVRCKAPRSISGLTLVSYRFPPIPLLSPIPSDPTRLDIRVLILIRPTFLSKLAVNMVPLTLVCLISVSRHRGGLVGVRMAQKTNLVIVVSFSVKLTPCIPDPLTNDYKKCRG